MKHVWLNKFGNKKLLIFFVGWSFDEKPFEFLTFDDLDVVVFYDYSEISFDVDFSGYEKYYFVGWSMGVYVGALLKDKLPSFEKAIALNGTPMPIDNEFGIPERTFELTLKYAEEGLKGKFYQNVFWGEEQLNRYLANPVQRNIQNRVEELHSLKTLINANICDAKGFYDLAYVAQNDKIIPSKNQIRAWEILSVPIIELADGHFPFYNFKSWTELCK